MNYSARADQISVNQLYKKTPPGRDLSALSDEIVRAMQLRRGPNYAAEAELVWDKNFTKTRTRPPHKYLADARKERASRR